MLNKVIIILLTGCLVLCFSSLLQAGETSVGGNVKLIVYDRPSGEHNGVQSSNYVGFTFRALYLYFYKELTDKVSIDLQPNWSASTGATPKFGSDVAKKNHPNDIEADFHGFTKAVVTTLLPKNFELSFGIVKPLFSWDYGHELFWEEEANGGKWSCNNYLGAIHDAGFELYKNFELGNVSLPTYLYVLNGEEQYTDNNKMPSVMATVEPEFGAIKLKTSLYMGNYNDGDSLSFMKYLVGASYEKGPFAMRAEYAAGTWSKKISGEDANPNGFYGKVFYRFAPWGRAMLHYDYVDNNFSGSSLGSEKYVTISPVLQLYASESSFIFFQYDIADWKRVKAGVEDKLKFKRLTVVWRTTF